MEHRICDAANMEHSDQISQRSYPGLPRVVVVGEAAIKVMSDPGFRVTPHLEFSTKLAGRLQLDISTTLAVMNRLPLWKDGAEHQALRREVASFLAEDRINKCARAADRMHQIARTSMNNSSINLLDMITRFANTFMEEVTGLPPIDSDLGDLPSIFSSNLGIRARRSLEASLHCQVENARMRFPSESLERHTLRVGQWTMGRDALIGTLGLSLRQHVNELDGRPLNSLRMTVVPTHTGVPAIGRIAKWDHQIFGCPISAGDLVECRLDSLSGSSSSLRQHFFGAGPHLCLGRSLALNFMSIVADALSEYNFGLQAESYCLKEHDVFDIPSVFTAVKDHKTQNELSQ